MKKRVTKSEIEVARKSSKVLFLISFILLVLLFVGFGFLYVMDVDLTPYLNIQKQEKKSSIPTNIKEKETVVESSSTPVTVDINDSNIQTFYNTVKVTNEDVCIEGGYREKRHVSVDDLTVECKFSLASKIYENDVEQGLDGKLVVKESAVKKAYEGLFGKDTYVKRDTIPCLFKTTFMNRDDYYFTEKVVPEEDDSLLSFEKILYAKRVDNKLDITSAVVFYEQVLSILCKDSRCEETIESLKPGVEYGEEYLTLYVDFHQKELSQYTYHFEMDDAGFYRYKGYDRTNE